MSGWRDGKILVTGGGGFIGGALVRRLVLAGLDVRSVSRQRYPDLDALGVEQIQGDLAVSRVATQAVTGCALVFHVAAKAGIWGDEDDYRRANTIATKNLVAASRRLGVTRFVFTSSPSVAQTDAGCDGGDEASEGIPDSHRTHYQATKAEAEKLVCAAHTELFRTVALRPRLVWGPGDRHLLPRLVERAKAGKLRMIGDGSALIDSSFITNVVDAHVAAADALDQIPCRCGGKAYFISNGEPRAMGTLINQLLEVADAPAVDRHLPIWLAHVLGQACEFAWRHFRLQDEPPMTRFLAYQLSTPNHYDIGAAERDLGYRPTISLDEGLDRLREHLELID